MQLFSIRINLALLSFGAVILIALILWPELLFDLTRTSEFMPHGFCFQWESDILMLHVISDSVIWLSYMGLSGLLAMFAWRFRTVFGRLPLWTGIASGGFIFFCGLTHLMGIVVIWQPLYWLDGGVKALTALTSFATLIGGVAFRGSFIQLITAGTQRDHLLAGQQQAVTQLQKALVTRETDLTRLTQAIAQQREEQVQIEQALTASEERFRRVFAVNPSPKLITRADNRQIVTVNPAFALLSGYTHAELIGQTTDALGLWAETSLITQTRTQLRQDGQVMDRELPFRTRDGNIRELLLSVVPVELDGVACFLTVMLDQTERKQAEAMWRVSDQRFQSIFDLSPDLICIASLDGYFRLVNPAFSRILGYAPEELLNARFMNFIHPDDHASVEAVIADKLSQGETVQSFQCRYIRKDGEVVWLEWISQPSDTMIFAIGRDVTERKQVEELLARQAEELRRSNTELEQFAYVASHDLQEPLRMVTSYVQLLQRRYQGQLDAKADMYIAYAVDGAVRMQTLIQDLLAYARVGRANRAFAPTDCARALEQVRADLAIMIADTGATITAGPLPTLLANADQIAQLFENLISNAIKFHGVEPPQIWLTATRQGAEWLFAVRDNGIGIEPQYTERIFVIFQRLHTRAEYPGTGIGLAICKKITDYHGGRIWLESQLGAGTTFYFSIPIIEAAPDPL